MTELIKKNNPFERLKKEPGWFLPNQKESIKKYFKVNDIKELLGENKLAIDWWVGNAVYIFK